jgi:type II secretory pathway pseudopilin PulG
MKKRILYSIIGILLILAAWFILWNRGNRQQQALLQEVKDVVNRVEAYRSRKGKLPESLTDLGLEERMEGPIYYEKRDSLHYYVWFGTSLGDSYTYDSEKKKWE